MPLGNSTDPRRVAVWIDLANHFLDTETRHDVPRSALLLVESGFGLGEARIIWEEEVTPAVGFNLFDVAGEWAGWPEGWLVERIAGIARRRRERRARRMDGLFAWLRRLPGRPNRRTWTAIERCMSVLHRTDAGARRSLIEDLEVLARLYFDFCPPDPSQRNAGERRRLGAIYTEVFLPIFSPLLVRCAGESPSEFSGRVDRALGLLDVDLVATQVRR